jgi:beta-phosphoglucomutase
MIPVHRIDYSPYPSGVIFDLDGTLIDNEAIHRELFQDIARSLGYYLSLEEYHSRLSGLGDLEVMEYILASAHRTRSSGELAALKLSRYLTRIQRGDVRATPGAAEYVHRLAERGVKMAVATNATQAEAGAALDLLGLGDVIRTRVSIEMVTRGKPCPDIPLRAARLLGLQPSQCLMYEDSLHGVQAATAAGIAVVGVGAQDPWRLLCAGVMTVISDFCGHELPALPNTLAGQSCLN